MKKVLRRFVIARSAQRSSCGRSSLECVSQADCPSGAICVDGQCLTDQPARICLQGQTCLNEVCVDLPNSDCTTTVECLAVFNVNGSCVDRADGGCLNCDGGICDCLSNDNCQLDSIATMVFVQTGVDDASCDAPFSR